MSFVYKGLKAEKTRHIVTDAEVDQQIQRILQNSPRIEKVTDRPTQTGDEVVLDYAGFCDGEQFAGGTAQNQTLTLGSGAFIPGFEEQLLDKVVGEQVTVEVTFPKEYHAENLAGKQAQFQCVIHEIRIKSSYDLDDTFAKEVGGCDTLEEMRSRMKESLQSYTDERGEMDLQDQLLRQAAETLEFEPTEKQVDEAVNEQMQNLSAQLARQGLSLEMYCSFMSTTEEQLRQDARPDAIASIRAQAAIELIVDLEQLEATKEELGEALALICHQNNMTLEQIKPYYDAQFEAAVTRSVLTTKAMQLIRDNAQINNA